MAIERQHKPRGSCALASRRWLRAAIIGSISGLVVVTSLLFGPCRLLYVRYCIAHAQSASEEAKAFELAARWTNGYTVMFFDKSGQEIFPTRDTVPLAQVATITIKWRWGICVSKKVVNPGNLARLLGE